MRLRPRLHVWHHLVVVAYAAVGFGTRQQVLHGRLPLLHNPPPPVQIPRVVEYNPPIYPSGLGFEVISTRPGSITINAKVWLGGPARPTSGRFVIGVRRRGGSRGLRTVWMIGIERPLFRIYGVPQRRSDLHYEIPCQFTPGNYDVFVQALDGSWTRHWDGTLEPSIVAGHTERVLVE
jgi:hypothetical protein